MKKYPAIALIELESIAQGILSADAMIKKAPVSVIKSGTVHNGKFIILIGGSVASVEESFQQGLFVAQNYITDSVFLPQVDNQTHDAILGKRKRCTKEALVVLEMSTVAANLHCSDAAVKGADVNIIEILLADDIGGKAITIFNGAVEEAEIALEIAQQTAVNPESIINTTIIPNIVTEIAGQINKSTVFGNVSLDSVRSGEL